MQLGLIARLRACRRPAVALAAGLIAVQAFLAGLASAQAALLLIPDLPGNAGFAVICHGNGGTASDPGTDPGKSGHPCCETCAAFGAGATLPAPPLLAHIDRHRIFEPPLPAALAILIAPRAVRAGTSQAPPRID
jgi:hypothetical protein